MGKSENRRARHVFGSAARLLGGLMLVLAIGLVGGTDVQAKDKFVLVEFKPALKKGAPLCKSKYGATGSHDRAFQHGTTKNCWSCPRGFKRSAKKIAGKNACVRKEKPRYSAALKRGVTGCAKGTFRHGLTDQCFACPAGFKRGLAPGKDLSKVKKACVKVNIDTQAFPPAEFVSWIKTNLPKIKRDYAPAMKSAMGLAKKLNTRSAKKAIRKRLKQGTPAKLQDIAPGADLATAAAGAGSKKLKTITINPVIDVSLIGGLTWAPVVIAQPITFQSMVPGSILLNEVLGADVFYYTAGAYSVGITAGIDFSVEVGMWVDEYDALAGQTWGFVSGGSAGVGGAWTIWLSYPRDAKVAKKVRFMGLTLSLSTGLGMELEHIRGNTADLTWKDLKDVM